ncbi:MAG TPA: hypothetical protein VJ860_02505 [Polyangia bacterium]|nr:hypothetical protein [Polyangia bacterium]
MSSPSAERDFREHAQPDTLLEAMAWRRHDRSQEEDITRASSSLDIPWPRSGLSLSASLCVIFLCLLGWTNCKSNTGSSPSGGAGAGGSATGGLASGGSVAGPGGVLAGGNGGSATGGNQSGGTSGQDSGTGVRQPSQRQGHGHPECFDR